MSRWEPINQEKVLRHLAGSRSMSATARRFGVTRERIRQIAKENGVKKIFIMPSKNSLTKQNTGT